MSLDMGAEMGTDVSAGEGAGADSGAMIDQGVTPNVERGPIQEYDPISLVDPLIATGGDGAEIASVSPGASAPLGLTLTGPDTRRGAMIPPYHCAGYHYPDTHIQTFSHTHAHGMGVVEYGGIPIMPRAEWKPEYLTFIGRQAPFSHDAEHASPGRYAVTLQDDQTEVEIIATPRGAHHRYLFPEGSAPVVIFDLGDNLPTTETASASVSARSLSELSLYQLLRGNYSERFGGARHHAAVRFDPEPLELRVWRVGEDGEVVTTPLNMMGSTDEPTDEASEVWPLPLNLEVSARQVGVIAVFPEGTRQIDARVALSFVDHDGAWGNLEAELPNTDLAERRAAVEALWRARLKRVKVRGEARDERRFTTAHYHALLMPSINNDVDGRYRGLDQEIHQADHPYYSDLSLWDTFRTLHSFYLLAHPELQRDILKSLTRMVSDGGSLPRWPLAHGYTGGMVGTPATQLFAEAHLKGLEGWDEEIAFESALAQSSGTARDARRGGSQSYLERGWVAADERGGSVSRTLEFAWSDHSLALWAESTLRLEATTLYERARSWRNHWDPAQGFLVGRNASGDFVELTSSTTWETVFVEGNAWHYLWYAPYDVEGMTELIYGGDTARFIQALSEYWARVYDEPDDLIPDDYYWHGNEPVMHYAWLASLLGDPELTAEATHHILETRYGHDPLKGLDGNDDSGTLSAWYLWAAMGVYPIAGTSTYAIGAPIFNRVEVTRVGSDASDTSGDPREGVWVIEAPGASLGRVPSALPSSSVGRGVIEHEELTGGLVFGYESSP